MTHDDEPALTLVWSALAALGVWALWMAFATAQ